MSSLNPNPNPNPNANLLTVTRNQFRSMVSNIQTVIARSMFSTRAGIGFGGKRDYYEVFGYNRRPTHADFVAKYLRQDIATRVIDAPVDGLWSDHPTVLGGAHFNTKWQDIVDEFDVFTALSKVDTFAGLGSYALLVIGIDDGRPLDAPVEMSSGTEERRNITYLQPYLEGSVEIETLDENPFSKRYGLPMMYRVTPGENLTKNSSILQTQTHKAFRVHHSRVLHLADRTLESPVFGHSRLEPVFNTLDDIMKVTGGSAETYWLTANRGMQVDVDKEMDLDEEDAANLQQEIDEYQHNLRRVMRTRGVKINELGSDVADPRGNFSVLISLLSANTGIPQRVLMGAEAGQLASQQDRANWAVQLEQRQSKWGAPKVLKPFVRQLVAMGVIRKPVKFEIQWAEAFKMNPFERGQTSAQQARSITNVSRAMETAQKIGIDNLISIEEAREMVAPGDQLLRLKGTATGTLVPMLSAPVNDPQNKVDLLDKQAEIAEANATQAEAEASAAETTTPAGATPDGESNPRR